MQQLHIDTFEELLRLANILSERSSPSQLPLIVFCIYVTFVTPRVSCPCFFKSEIDKISRDAPESLVVCDQCIGVDFLDQHFFLLPLHSLRPLARRTEVTGAFREAHDVAIAGTEVSLGGRLFMGVRLLSSNSSSQTRTFLRGQAVPKIREADDKESGSSCRLRVPLITLKEEEIWHIHCLEAIHCLDSSRKACSFLVRNWKCSSCWGFSPNEWGPWIHTGCFVRWMMNLSSRKRTAHVHNSSPVHTLCKLWKRASFFRIRRRAARVRSPKRGVADLSVCSHYPQRCIFFFGSKNRCVVRTDEMQAINSASMLSLQFSEFENTRVPQEDVWVARVARACRQAGVFDEPRQF